MIAQPHQTSSTVTIGTYYLSTRQILSCKISICFSLFISRVQQIYKIYLWFCFKICSNIMIIDCRPINHASCHVLLQSILIWLRGGLVLSLNQYLVSCGILISVFVNSVSYWCQQVHYFYNMQMPRLVFITCKYLVLMTTFYWLFPEYSKV